MTVTVRDMNGTSILPVVYHFGDKRTAQQQQEGQIEGTFLDRSPLPECVHPVLPGGCTVKMLSAFVACVLILVSGSIFASFQHALCSPHNIHDTIRPERWLVGRWRHAWDSLVGREENPTIEWKMMKRCRQRMETVPEMVRGTFLGKILTRVLFRNPPGPLLFESSMYYVYQTGRVLHTRRVKRTLILLETMQ